MIFLQSANDWSFDLLSFLLGLIFGSLVAVAVYRYLPDILAFRDRIVNRIRETHAWVRSGVEVRFQTEMAEYVRQYHLGGQRGDLGDIFVEPRVLRPIVEADPEHLPDLGPARLQYIWPELTAGVALPPPEGATLRQLLLNGRRVILRGERGAGKTTLLAYCAHLCATATDMGAYTFLLPSIPVIVHLAEVDLTPPEVPEGEEPPDPNPLTPLIQILQQRTSPLTSRGIGDLLRKKMTDGQVLLLLDGWDDLSSDQRPEYTDWLNRLLIAYPDTQVIMAGPLRGYGPLLEMGFVISGILPWRVGQVAKFGQKWAKAAGIDRRIPTQVYWEPGRSLVETHFRLAHILTEDGKTGSMPRRQVELLETHLRRLLPQVENEDDPPWLPPATRELWQQMAYLALTGRHACLPRTEIDAIIETILTDYEALESRGADQRLVRTLTESGIFIDWKSRGIGFISPIWRDFLAAAHMAQTQEHELVAEHLHDPYWDGAVLFFVGRVTADELAVQLLTDKSPDPMRENLFRAAAWLPETISIDGSKQGEWRRQVMIRLGQMIVKGNMPLALRQRAAIAMAQTGENGVLVFLRQILRQPDPNMRQVALAALPRLGAEVAIELLGKMSADSEGNVRSAAVHALAWIHDPATENPLLSALVDQDDPMNRAVVQGLALNGTEHAYEILREAMEEEALHLRRSAVYGLSFLDQHWAVELLDRMEREDEQWVVKSAAGDALESIVQRNKPVPWKKPQAGDLVWLIQWAAAKERAVPGGAAAMPVLLEALGDAEDTAIRVTAAMSLGHLSPQNGAMSPLQGALRDSNAMLREAAFWSLLRISHAWDQPIFGSS